jgi:hypothetical protein
VLTCRLVDGKSLEEKLLLYTIRAGTYPDGGIGVSVLPPVYLRVSRQEGKQRDVPRHRERGLSRADVWAMLDEQARRFLGMSAEEFVAAARANRLPDHPLVAHLVLLAGEGSCSE